MNVAQEHPPLLAYHAPPRLRRPAGVLVLGILGLVLAVLGTFVHGVFLLALATNVLGVSIPALGVSFTAPAAAVPGALIALGSVVFWAALVRACAAAIRMRPWARWEMVRWALIYLMWVVVSGVAACTVVLDAELAGLPAEFADEHRANVYERTAMTAGFEAIYPVVVMLYMVRRKVVAAFAAAEATSEPQGSPSLIPTTSLPVLAAADGTAQDAPHGAEP